MANRMMKYIRRACDGMGIPRNEADPDRLLKAIQKADKGLEDRGNPALGVSMHAGINTGTNAYRIRRLRGGDGVTVSLAEETGEAVIAVGGGGISLATLAPVMMIEEQRSSGAGPRALTKNNWSRRPINTVTVNQISGASLTNEQITLPAGTYRVSFLGTGSSAGHHRTRLQNITGTATLGIGNSADSRAAGPGNDTANPSMGIARFTLAVESILEVQTYWAQSIAGTGYMGDAEENLSGDVHRDGWIEIIKEA